MGGYSTQFLPTGQPPALAITTAMFSQIPKEDEMFSHVCGVWGSAVCA